MGIEDGYVPPLESLENQKSGAEVQKPQLSVDQMAQALRERYENEGKSKGGGVLMKMLAGDWFGFIGHARQGEEQAKQVEPILEVIRAQLRRVKEPELRGDFLNSVRNIAVENLSPEMKEEDGRKVIDILMKLAESELNGEENEPKAA